MLINYLAKLSRSSRNAVSAALIIIMAIAMYNWAIAPHTNYLFAAQRYESVMGNIAEECKVIHETVKSKREKLQKLREQFAELQSALFTPNKAKEFFSDLQVLSEEAGCTLYSLDFAADNPDFEGKQASDALSIAAKRAMLGVVGTYSNVIKLVERLGVRTQKVWIDSVKMEALNDDAAQLKCDITITIYTIKDKEATVHE